MSTLYEINEEMRAIIDKIVLSEGVITPEIEAELEACQLSRLDKLEAYNKVMHNKQFIIDTAEGVAQRLDAEADRIRALNRTRENDLRALGGRVKNEMEDKGEKKINFPTGGFTVKKGSQAISILNPELVPKRFIKVDEVESFIKKDMRDAIEGGEVIEGVQLITNPTTLTVR